MNKIFLLPLFIIILTSNTFGQYASSFSLSNETYVSSTNALPFWLWANTDGKIEENNSFLNFSSFEATGLHFFNDSNAFIKTGAEINYGIGNNDNYLLANQLFARINLNNWEFNIGNYYHELQFEGLSTTNGNLGKSRNARPHPKIGIRVADYKPLPWIGKYLAFKGEYNEGFLYDDRYVERTHLHHKSFYLKSDPFENFSIEAGVEHSVMWGGTSPIYGKLPSDFRAYFDYITGSSGDERFLFIDQNYISGNQYGTYQLLLSREFEKINIQFNLSHPFEDLSGVNWQNWPDNILTFSVKFKEENKIINHILYEFTDSRQQGISDSIYRWDEESQKWDRREPDNYYAHSIYRSGVTYKQKMMSSPLFSPLTINDGISYGPQSNRLFSHHIGVKGKLRKDVAWKGMLTYIQHIGKWENEYNPARKQFSGLLKFVYFGEAVPFQIDLTLAGDVDNFQSDRLGIQIGLNYNF